MAQVTLPEFEKRILSFMSEYHTIDKPLRASQLKTPARAALLESLARRCWITKGFAPDNDEVIFYATPEYLRKFGVI